MNFTIEGEPVDGKAYSLDYPNDMMNGILIDMPHNYIFLSDVEPDHKDMIDFIEDEEEEVEHYDLTETDIDWYKAPHSWVFNSMVGVIVRSATELCEEASGRED